MIIQGMAYFVPFESFTCPKLLTSITLRHILQSYIIRTFKEKNKVKEDFEYQLDTFLDYSSTIIVNAFIVLGDQSFHVKKQIDLNK